MKQPISGIVAVSNNGMIGLNGYLPWDIPEESAYFENKVAGAAMVIGRRTYETMREDFPDVFVVSRQAIIPLQPGHHHVLSVKEGIEAAIGTGKPVFIIGGAPIYEAAIPYYDRFFLTRIEAVCQGDTMLPPDIPCAHWDVVSENKSTYLDRRSGSYATCRFIEYAIKK